MTSHLPEHLHPEQLLHAEQLLVGGAPESRTPIDLRVSINAAQLGSLLIESCGGSASFAAKVGRAIRRSFDLAYDGQHTGRYAWAQLSKTEKTNIGSLVEIWLGRELGLADGSDMDFSIAGYEVDCKFSGRSGGWMLPPEVVGHFALLVTANDSTSLMSVGLIHVTPERLSRSKNRDLKSTLAREQLRNIHWLIRDEQFPENTLLQLAPMDAAAMTRTTFNGARVSGQERIDLLFRRAEGRRISRNVIATVAQQNDFMKRVRSNGGARTRLAQHGYVLLGHYAAHREVAAALGVPQPAVGEIVSVRLTPATESVGAVQIDGQLWRRWTNGDAIVPAPLLPHR